MFPMTVLKQSGRAPSTSGGKDFHLILITTNDGRALYINRWGKARQWGNGWKCEHYVSASDAREAYRKKRREKLEGDYRDHIVDKSVIANDEAELRKCLGAQLVAAIGAEKWAQLLPGADTSGLKAGAVETDENDPGLRINRRDPKLVEQPKETVEDRIKSNPLWGMFG